MISATNTAVRWSNLVFIERGEPQLSMYGMKKSFTLKPRDLCRLKILVWGAKWELWLHKNYCFHKNHLTCNGYRKIWWISTENFRVKSLLDIRGKMVGAESVNSSIFSIEPFVLQCRRKRILSRASSPGPSFHHLWFLIQFRKVTDLNLNRLSSYISIVILM
jgi:hypothetical protein